MDHCPRVWTVLLIALGMTIASKPARTQEPPAAEEPPAVGVPPLGGTRPAEAGTPAAEDPAVEAILATNPSTPLEWVRAAKILADLRRPELAKAFLKKTLDAQLDQEQLVALEDFFGSGVFAEMATRTELAPEARQLGDAVLSAVRSYLQDPARLASLVGNLQDASADVRYRALVELRRAGGAAAGPMVAALANPGRAAEHANVRAALVRLGADAVDPLIAILESGDPQLVAQAILVLADLGDERAIVFLLAPFASNESVPLVRQAAEVGLLKLLGRRPTTEEAAGMLVERAEEYSGGSRPLREDVDGRVELWAWDAAAKQLTTKSYLAEDAARVVASRLAREAFTIAPEAPKARLLYLATMLEEAAYANGLDRPLDASENTPAGRASEFGPEIVEELLVYGLESGHAPVAAAAARILGQTGKAETLLYQGARPAPLVQATWHADRRVRFAAVEAILGLEPILPFPGSSRVTEALSYFASSHQAPRVLVAGPSTAESQRVGGYLVAMGYELETAVTGRDVVRKLLASPDYELALIDAAIQRPTLDFLLQELRHDCRTARLPVGVIGRAGRFERARYLARRDPLAEAVTRPHTEDVVRGQVDGLVGLLGRERVAPAERQSQTAQALKWLAALSGDKRAVFDFHRAEEAALAALFLPSVAPDAIVVAGNLATPESQQALVDLASRWTQPLELRGAAVRSFRHSVEENGILLTTDQILRQYDRYNESETLGVATQQVLGLILDTIETPARIEATRMR